MRGDHCISDWLETESNVFHRIGVLEQKVLHKDEGLSSFTEKLSIPICVRVLMSSSGCCHTWGMHKKVNNKDGGLQLDDDAWFEDLQWNSLKNEMYSCVNVLDDVVCNSLVGNSFTTGSFFVCRNRASPVSLERSLFRTIPRMQGQGQSFDPTRSFCCDYCGIVLPSHRAKQGHERLHRGTAFVCHTCQKAFTEKWLLQRHIKHVHNTPKVRDQSFGSREFTDHWSSFGTEAKCWHSYYIACVLTGHTGLNMLKCDRAPRLNYLGGGSTWLYDNLGVTNCNRSVSCRMGRLPEGSGSLKMMERSMVHSFPCRFCAVMCVSQRSKRWTRAIAHWDVHTDVSSVGSSLLTTGCCSATREAFIEW